ncbi:hypothetical protein [Streptomyces showdoensis]|uniref:Uncharacterized protein n=1 Tax=Streptomyces showdoensis TaxID=68268 RepID=A0A2P2GWF6_STREW|nr:hypothetical protein [Streptomyces showdoensis]KKZ75840.1 hypothetical protein VO63_01125 [Streptomyces showdoensis]
MYGKPIGASAVGGTGATLAATGGGLSPLAVLGLIVAATTLIAAGLALRSLVPVIRGDRPGRR